MVGQRGEDLRAARAVDAVVLGRAAHDPLLLRLPRLAPLVRVGHPAPPRDAGHRAGLGLRGRPYGADGLVDAGSPRLGVRQAGAAQRAAGGACHFQARLQERADPGAHAGRDQPRHHGQRGGRRGDGLRLAGCRAPALRGHRPPRLPGGAGDGPARRRDDRDRQPPRGHPVRRHRPEDSILNGRSAMNGSRSATLTLAWRLAAFRTEGFPVIPTAIIATVALVAIFADALAPYNPELGTLGDRFRPPAWQAGGSEKYLLGTDHLGRDVLSRLIFGARGSMIVGFTAVIVAGFIGTVLGIISRYPGRWGEQVILRLTDTWLALPALTFAIFLAAIVGPSVNNIIIILADGKKGLMAGYWWLTVLPGSCIMLMVLSANLLGDWLRVKLDPQLRQL